MSWRRVPSGRKTSRIRRARRRLPARGVVLAQDETDLLLCPPLRHQWARQGQPASVLLGGGNARRVIFGAMNLAAGHRLWRPVGGSGPKTSSPFCAKCMPSIVAGKGCCWGAGCQPYGPRINPIGPAVKDPMAVVAETLP
jgi:hypothetical protein